MFKVGDRVKCINVGRLWYYKPTEGTSYVVQDVFNNLSSPAINIRMPEYDVTIGFLAKHFILVESSFEFKSNCGKFARSGI